MATSTYKGTKEGEVRVSDEDRTKARKAFDQARAALDDIAQLAARNLGIDKIDVQTVTLSLSAPGGVDAASGDFYQLTIQNGECVVYEDPPGICRPCGA